MQLPRVRREKNSLGNKVAEKLFELEEERRRVYGTRRQNSCLE